MTFRPDINGLRAWAVLAVLLFHFEVPGFQGGFAGVDVFFVISGYLMTEIIFRRLQQNHFSITGFYGDRARRIIPALTGLCAVMLVIGWFYFPSYEYIKLGKHIWGSSGFFSNHLYLAESGYFEKSQLSGKWLQHTWSLSVEWQFYLAYPLLVLILCQLAGLAATRYGLALCAAVSLGYCIKQSLFSADTAFYLLPARLWELLAGGLLVLFPVTVPARWKKIIELSGITLLLITFTQVNGKGWPGWQAIVPVIATLLIILSSQQASIFTSHNVAQWLGKISYSLYLWHWPIAHYLQTAGLLPKYPVVMAVAGMVASILLAHLSWKYIEQVFNKRQTRSFPLAALLLSAVVIFLLGYGVWQQKGFPNRQWEVAQKEKQAFIEKYENMHKAIAPYYHFECGFFDEQKYVRTNHIDPACTQVPAGKIIFLWGDSHAQALSHGLRSWAKQRYAITPYAIAQVATSECKPAIPPQWETAVFNEKCDHSNQFALQEIARLKPEYVVMAQERQHEHTDWDGIANTLHQLGAHQVILMGPLPQWYPSLPQVIATGHWQKDFISLHDESFVSEARLTNQLLREKYPGSANLHYISIIDALCQNEQCPVRIPEGTPGTGELIAFDYGHLTPEGSVYTVDIVFKGLQSP